jgi:hypothetical protein
MTAGSGVTDHGALTGLADDDHPQYLHNAPTSGRNTILATGDHPGLIIREQGTQTTGLQRWIQSDGVTVGLQVMRRGTLLGELYNAGYGGEIPSGDGAGANAFILSEKTGGGWDIYGVGISLRPKTDYVRIHNSVADFSIGLARGEGLVEAGRRDFSQTRRLTLQGSTADGASAEGIRLVWDVRLATPNSTARLATVGYLDASSTFLERVGILSGGDVAFTRASSTAERLAATMAITLPTTTDASRTSRQIFSLTDFAATREVLRLEADGSGPVIGVFGAGGTGRVTVAAAATDAATTQALVNEVRAALIGFGWLQ